MENLADRIWEYWERDALPVMDRYIRIPCVSPVFDRDWQQHGQIEKAVELIRSWVSSRSIRGLRFRVQQLPGRTPLIDIEIQGVGGEVVIYGHLDKQPEFHGWEPGLGPWTPVRRGARLYGRGGADDGYAVFAAVGAVEALQYAGIQPPTTRILIECSEESGSPDLAPHLEALVPKLGSPDLVIVLDSEAGDYDRLWLTTSLRGYIAGRLKVDVLTSGVHSGGGGGVVPAPFRIARHLLDRVECGATGEMPEWMRVEIPANRVLEAAATGAILNGVVVDKFPWIPEIERPTANASELLLRNAWWPALTIIGQDGMAASARASSTIEPGIELVLSIRVPPTATAERLGRKLQRELEKEPPTGSRVSFDVTSTSDGWSSPENPSWMREAIDRASREFFGADAASIGTGGTIPFIPMLGRKFPASMFVITGVLGPHSSAHGPNEFLEIPTAKRVTGVVARLLEAVAARPSRDVECRDQAAPG